MGEQAGSGQGEQDKRDYYELRYAVTLAGWNIKSFDSVSGGVVLTLRKQPISGGPEDETRTIHGKDDADALRKF